MNTSMKIMTTSLLALGIGLSTSALAASSTAVIKCPADKPVAVQFKVTDKQNNTTVTNACVSKDSAAKLKQAKKVEMYFGPWISF